MLRVAIVLSLAALAAAPSLAQVREGFAMGPVIEGYGPHAPVEADVAIPEGTVFRVAFDGTRGAEEGEPNPTLQTAARFLNMHAAAGVPKEDIHLAVVIHGKGGFDLISDAAWQARGKGEANPTLPLLEQLLANQVRVILCGQSAAGNGIAKAELAEGVELALSATTAHALLQQQGYTLNPF